MTKKRWTVHVPGYLPLRMLGEACSYEEALYAARLIWPTATVE